MNNNGSEPASYKCRNRSQSVHNEVIGGSGSSMNSSYSSRSYHHRSTPLEEVRNRSASLSPRAVMTGRAKSNSGSSSYTAATTRQETNILSTRHRSGSQGSISSTNATSISPRLYHASASSRRDSHTKPSSSSSSSVSSRSHRHGSDAGCERGSERGGGRSQLAHMTSKSSRKDGGVTSFLNAAFNESTASSSSSKSARGGGSSSTSVTSEKDSKLSPRNTHSGSVSSTSSKRSHALH